SARSLCATASDGATWRGRPENGASPRRPTRTVRCRGEIGSCLSRCRWCPLFFQSDVAVRIQRTPPAGEDDSRRAEFFDDGRARQRRALGEPVALPHGTFPRVALEPDAAPLDERLV